jgi:hypothetical protein
MTAAKNRFCAYLDDLPKKKYEDAYNEIGKTIFSRTKNDPHNATLETVQKFASVLRVNASWLISEYQLGRNKITLAEADKLAE